MCSCIKGVKILCKEVVVGTIADSFLEVRIVLSFLLFSLFEFCWGRRVDARNVYLRRVFHEYLRFLRIALLLLIPRSG